SRASRQSRAMPRARLRSERAMLARLEKLDLRPALARQAQAHRRRREIHELAGMILGESRCETLLECRGLPRIGRAHPSRGHDVHAFERAIDAVLVAEPERRDVELERTDGPEDQLVARQRPEELRRAFLAELSEPLLQRLQLQRILQHRAPE